MEEKREFTPAEQEFLDNCQAVEDRLNARNLEQRYGVDDTDRFFDYDGIQLAGGAIATDDLLEKMGLKPENLFCREFDDGHSQS